MPRVSPAGNDDPIAANEEDAGSNFIAQLGVNRSATVEGLRFSMLGR